MAGPTPDQIFVLIPDSVGPTVDAESPVDLQHVVGLSLGSAINLSSTLPPEGLHLALCNNSLRPTLGLGRQDYWAEITPILRRWQSVNDATCPSCHRVIRVNMARHLRASHTQCQCFWRCPVTPFPMWFSSELNGKDHLERIHSFREGSDTPFMTVCVSSAWNGSAGVPSLKNVRLLVKPYGWMWPWLVVPARSSVIIMLLPTVRPLLLYADSSVPPSGTSS